MAMQFAVQGAAKVSLLMIGQQAIMDAYLCLLHLTAGILVGKAEIVIVSTLPTWIGSHSWPCYGQRTGYLF